MVSFDDLAAGSDIHDAHEVAGKVVLTPRADCHDEFHTLVGHVYEVLDRGFAIFIKQGERGLYESAEIMRLH